MILLLLLTNDGPMTCCEDSNAGPSYKGKKVVVNLLEQEPTLLRKRDTPNPLTEKVKADWSFARGNWETKMAVARNESY
jgi:hypothetical protein